MLASLSYVVRRTSSAFDLHISQPSDGDKVRVVIPGAKKLDMQAQIDEYLAKLFEFDIDTEVDHFLNKCHRKIDEIVATACKQRAEDKIERFDSIYRSMATIRNLEDLYQGLLSIEDIDESVFVKSSTVRQQTNTDTDSGQVHTSSQTRRGQPQNEEVLELRYESRHEGINRTRCRRAKADNY